MSRKVKQLSLTPVNKTPRPAEERIDIKRFIKLNNKGFGIHLLARIFGISTSCVRRLRKRHHLSYKGKRTTILQESDLQRIAQYRGEGKNITQTANLLGISRWTVKKGERILAEKSAKLD